MKVAALLGLWLALGSASAWAGEGAARIQGEFHLNDARNGKPLRSADLRGKVQLVFFGFTHCALTCPVGLSRVRDALAELGADADKVAPIFITTDPARDSARVMREYAANFDPRIIPLVGDKKAIAASMRSFRLEAQKTAVKSALDYQMDHPAIVYLMDAEGRFQGVLPSNGSSKALARRIRQILLKAP